MKLDNICNQVYVVALNEARMSNHEYVTPEHFLYATLMFEIGKDLILKSGGNLKEIQKDLILFFEKHMTTIDSDNPVDSYEFVKMFEIATAAAHSSGSDIVVLGNILASIFNLPHSHAAYIMIRNGVNRFVLLKSIAHELHLIHLAEELELNPHLIEESEQAQNDAEPLPEDDKTFLAQFTQDLTQSARDGLLDTLIGRVDILERTMQVLCRRLKNNPVHVGDPGVGKTAIVEGLANAIAQKNSAHKVPQMLKNATIYYLDLGLVVAGTKFRGDFEERLIKVMNIIAKKPNPIVYIDEIHSVVGAGAVSGGGMDATSILKPYLAKGQIKFLGSTTHEEYKKYFEKDRALSRRFQKIDISEPTLSESVDILEGIKDKYEKFHNVKFTKDIIYLTCELSQKYMNDKSMPDKAIDVLDETGSFLRMNSASLKTLLVTANDIERTIALIAKIPEQTVSKDENEKLKMLEQDIRKEIFGQDDAVLTVVNSIKASRAGLNDEQKPVASLLFVGPTGVGKTEIAKTLAKLLNVQLLRFDMSEYQEKHSVARLIGAPPGYVGFDEGGLLTEAIRKTPHCVLLLDEIEKAHSDIYNVLLQIMDYGSLTDNIGKKADFRNVIIIMTSNAGAKEMSRRIIGYDENRLNSGAIDKEVERIFNPEFRNRLDEIIVFKHLDENMAKLITTKAIKQLENRLIAKKVKIKLTDAATAYIYSKGYSEMFGAREIIRVVEREIKQKLVELVLFGTLANGGTATVDYKNKQIVVSPKALKSKAKI